MYVIRMSSAVYRKKWPSNDYVKSLLDFSMQPHFYGAATCIKNGFMIWLRQGWVDVSGTLKLNVACSVLLSFSKSSPSSSSEFELAAASKHWKNQSVSDI